MSHRTPRPLSEEYGEILPEIPVYFADISRKILETVFTFTSKGNITHDTIDIQDQVPIKIKDITVIPYIVDHSAYNSFMFLVLADNKKILYTGDYRNTGYKRQFIQTNFKKDTEK